VFIVKHAARGALVGAVALVLAACGGDDAPSTAATVNGTEIATSQVEAQAEIIGMNPQLQQQLAGADEDQAEQQLNALALGQLIFEVLLRDGADELDVEVTEQDVDDARAEIAVQFGGEEPMYAQLEEEQGLDRDEVDRQLELVALQDAIVAELGTEVSEADVQEAYEQGTPARHILVEEEDQAAEAIERIEDGEDFAAVAQDSSIDGTAQAGGDLGFVQPGTTVPEFEDALFDADEGELVGPVQSDFGFHVIERLEKPALTDVEDQLRATLEEQAAQEGQGALGAFLTERMQEADVQVDPYFGQWDAETGQVVPDDPIQPEQPEQPVPDEEPVPDDQ
jgi:parvulin-like peptidyl-prolyl isomerase